jgi:hypothetical protein
VSLLLVVTQPSKTRETIGQTSNISYTPIYALNDDVLLNIFDVYRLADTGEYEDTKDGDGERGMYWNRQRWWYKLAHVCRIWRNLIFSSPSRLHLHLLCTYGVPVADMLAHSPPFPLIIYYQDGRSEISAQDKSGIMLALSHRDRVRRISFWMPTPNLRKFIMAMGGQYPNLEQMHIEHLTREPPRLAFPSTFQAPKLSRLASGLTTFLPLTTVTTAGLISLKLVNIPSSPYFPPSHILSRLSVMHQLETLVIQFSYPFSNLDMERQSSHTPKMTQVTLTNLRSFVYLGTSAYLDGLVSWISAPSLSNLKIHLGNQPTFTISSLFRFMQTSENLRFHAVKLVFNWDSIEFVVLTSKNIPALQLNVMYERVDWQVACALQILGTFSPILSVVEQVVLGYRMFNQWQLPNNKIDRTQWRELLGPFSNAKTLCVQDGLVTDTPYCLLQPDDREVRPGAVPNNLKELEYAGGCDARDAFTAFTDERQVAGHPVNLTVVDQGTIFRSEWL